MKKLKCQQERLNVNIKAAKRKKEEQTVFYDKSEITNMGTISYPKHMVIIYW